MRSHLLSAVAAAIVLSAPVVPAGGQASLNDALTPFLAKYDLPAVAAAVVKDGKIVAAGAVGTRRAGVNIPVTVEDRFHIGSDTKAMTATLAAMAVEDGKLTWTTTVGEAFPELASTMNLKLAPVTLRQLLSHSSGIAADSAEVVELYEKSASQDGNLDDLRLWLLKEWCPKPMAADPGAKFIYSNLNFIIAGMMVERAYGKTWEELVTERVFIPLGLKSAGIGSQSGYGKVDAPLGHITVDGKQKPILGGPMCDSIAVVGPAGMAHMSILDFAKWAAWNAGEGKRGPALLRPETIKLLHTPVITAGARPDAAPGTPAGGDYALGWGKVKVDWAPSPIVHHAGSNSMNLAHIWVDPERDFAMVVVTNISNRKADEALFAIAPMLYERFSGVKK